MSSSNTTVLCLSVLDDISELVGSGYLSGATPTTIDGFVSIISGFIESLLLLPSIAQKPTSPIAMTAHATKVKSVYS